MSNSCQVCLLDFVSNNNCIACDLCDYWFHYSCTNLTYVEFIILCENPSLPWECPTCIANTHCAKCNIQFIRNSHQKSICCDHCNKYYHLNCTKLTLTTFNTLANSNESWYCRTCTNEIFPFNTLDNNKFLNFFDKKKVLPLPQLNPNYDPKCSICSKLVKTNNRKILCSN